MTAIRVLDTETQGLEAEHMVCEIGWCDLVLSDAGWEIGSHGSTLCRVDEMPPQARAVHHISAVETQAFPPFSAEAMWAQAKADGIDVVAAHYLAFDVMRFGEPQLPMICTYKAALRIWPQAPAHGNGVLRYWLEDQGLIAPDHALTLPPHRAGPDAYVTAHVLLALLQLAKGAEMVAWTRDPAVLPTCPIGKFRGKPWPDVEGGFLLWMLSQPTMEEDLKWNARRELDRRKAA